MKNFSVAFMCLLLFACQAEPQSVQVENELKTTMRTYLYNSVNNDSSKVKYTIEEVNYYPEEKEYDCEFKVRMQLKNTDTVGYMKAYISKDYKIVRRTS